jgi:hypothetical protein
MNRLGDARDNGITLYIVRLGRGTTPSFGQVGDGGIKVNKRVRRNCSAPYMLTQRYFAMIRKNFQNALIFLTPL